jgi:hypothetical protein
MLRITSFGRKGNAFLKLDEDVQWMEDADREAEEDDDSYHSEVSDAEDVPEIMPETRLLALPSSLAPGEIDRLGLVDLARQEEQLRRGQINDALEGLRMALGEKSLYYRTDVRNNKHTFQYNTPIIDLTAELTICRLRRATRRRPVPRLQRDGRTPYHC